MKGVPSIELLESTHTFPSQFTYKVFGPNTEAFRESAEASAVGIAGSADWVSASTRESGKGNHQCVTLEVFVQSAHQIQALYGELQKLEGVRMIL